MKTIQALIAAVSLLVALSSPAAATPGDATATATHDAARTAALLDRAEAHYRAQGEKALAAFSQAGEFKDGELYVYVLGRDGVMLSSGGSSAALIGRNLRDMTDADGKPFFREILEGAKSKGNGVVEYRWFNPMDGRTERKIASYRAVGDAILIAGYYVPRASFELAKSLLWRAVHEYKQHGDRAFEHFNDVNGSFVQDELYVFVIGLDDQVVYAHGGAPRQIGRNVGEQRDASGKFFVREMIGIAKKKGEGELQYTWRNPATQKIEPKRTYVVRVGDKLIGSGAFTLP
ncbi:cache domain-containing protein [Aromatoleum anaerobium]|uniref:Single Cache domain-containing protein n=1 Tax=Aromatoleum anaerobium TaxID=182180 RepID=A0ABX1PPS5_9RHOO|nr:cache domain-containing protein [Aromatoleum anaerobium]MCK0507999.1 cache domain-containing protein [Aromatoleum anaerobium]